MTHRALQRNDTLTFHDTDNPALLCFSKSMPQADPAATRPSASSGRPEPVEGRVFVVANTDPHWMQHGSIRMPIDELGIGPQQSYVVEDLLDDSRYVWRGEWNYVKLDPAERVAHIFVIRD
jgi:starch synthase (maltosyl-transferring)